MQTPSLGMRVELQIIHCMIMRACLHALGKGLMQKAKYLYDDLRVKDGRGLIFGNMVFQFPLNSSYHTLEFV